MSENNVKERKWKIVKKNTVFLIILIFINSLPSTGAIKNDPDSIAEEWQYTVMTCD